MLGEFCAQDSREIIDNLNATIIINSPLNSEKDAPKTLTVDENTAEYMYANVRSMTAFKRLGYLDYLALSLSYLSKP